MKLKLISFRLGNILDFGEATCSEDIKQFVKDRPNADCFHAHPENKNHPFYLAGMRVSKKDPVFWHKEFYTGQERFA